MVSISTEKNDQKDTSCSPYPLPEPVKDSKCTFVAKIKNRDLIEAFKR